MMKFKPYFLQQYSFILLSFLFFILIPQNTLGQSNAECAVSCNPYDPISNPQSCGGLTQLSCSGSTYSNTVNQGNGWCYDVFTCSSLVGQGNTFSGGYWNNPNCVCEFNGPSCQIVYSSSGTVNGPSYECSGGGGGGGSSCNNNTLCDAGETNSSCPLDCPTVGYTISAAPFTRSIVNGQSTTYFITLSPTNSSTLSNLGTYTFVTPIAGCPMGATCTYSGGNTATMLEGTNGAGEGFVEPAFITVTIVASTVTPATYPLTFSVTKNGSTAPAQNIAVDLIINSGGASTTTGTLSPASPTCTITSGESTCTVNLTWSTTNPVGTSAITAVGMANYNANAGTNISFTVPYGGRIFYLYNNAVLLATSNAVAICDSGTSWNGTVCQASGGTPITISSFNPYYTSITNYPTINDNSVYWTTTGNPTSCIATGASPWGDGSGTVAVNASISTGNHYQGVYPGVGTYTYILTCSKAGVSDATATFSVPVSTAVTTYTITVTKPIGGTIRTLTNPSGTPDGLISCGTTTCTRQYNDGTQIYLEALPDTSYWKFVGWGGGSCSGTGICALTINGNKSVTAQFRPKSLLYEEF